MSGRRIQSFVTQFLRYLIDPSICPGCAEALLAGQHYCSACVLRLEPMPKPCLLCGLENKSSTEVCAVCLYDPPAWDKMIAPLIYRGMTRDLLIQLKFSQQLEITRSLALQLSRYFNHSDDRPDILIPVPLHPKRLIERGFNQAFEIGTIISSLTDIPLKDGLLRRIKNTESQSGLSAAKRQQNIRNSFQYESSQVYSHVAIVDDIITTGSTVNEITRVLKRAGINRVDVWGLARVPSQASE